MHKTVARTADRCYEGRVREGGVVWSALLPIAALSSSEAHRFANTVGQRTRVPSMNGKRVNQSVLGLQAKENRLAIAFRRRNSGSANTGGVNHSLNG